MLARTFRLSRERDFKNIFQGGRRFQGKFYLVRVLPKQSGFSRAAVVVSLKVSKKAVVRNRLKRQTRAIVEQFWNKIIQPVDIIITLHSTAVDQSFIDLQEDLYALFKKSNI